MYIFCRSDRFTHSPESEFVEVERTGGNDNDGDGVASGGSSNRTNLEARHSRMFFNPDRPTSSSSSSAVAVAAASHRHQRALRDRERRLRELLDRRQTLVSQIEQLRSARELLFPAENSVPSSPSPSPSSPMGEGGGGRLIVVRDWMGTPDGLASASSSATPSPQLPPPAPPPPSSSPFQGATPTTTTTGRPIDEWAVNRRLSIERRR